MIKRGPASRLLEKSLEKFRQRKSIEKGPPKKEVLPKKGVAGKVALIPCDEKKLLFDFH